MKWTQQRCQVALNTLETAAVEGPRSVGDDELDAPEAPAGKLAQEGGPEVFASEGPMSMPRISRRPSALTPTATMTATETMRPFWRTFT